MTPGFNHISKIPKPIFIYYKGKLMLFYRYGRSIAMAMPLLDTKVCNNFKIIVCTLSRPL